MKRILLLLSFIVVNFLLPAQESKIFHITNVDSVSEIELDRFWKFHNGDDSAWATSGFDDSKWDTIDAALPFKGDSNAFTGIAWFRLQIDIDSNLNDVPLYLFIYQEGASELFLDGKKLYSFGKPGSTLETELRNNPHEIPFSFQYKTPGKHILALRYSNLDYRKFFKKYDQDKAGFKLRLGKQAILDSESSKTIGYLLATTLGVFLLTLSFVHLLLFLFLKKQRTNLFYSIFVMLLGLLFILPILGAVSNDSVFSAKADFYFFLILLFFFYSMLVLEYSLFKRVLNKYFWFSTLMLIVSVLLVEFGEGQIVEWVMFSFIISTVVASFFIVIKSIIKKVDGAWIIGTGSLFFLIFMLIILALLIVTPGNVNVNLNDGVFSLIIFVLILLAIMSIPISMSIYLARDFAKTSKNLENKLNEVEALSAKSLEQEKEKQKILESQKETLETQVTERTAEIVEQKSIIERKNKDITDSIDYAKTIQKAILPTNQYRTHLFPDSFILFKPKDIVSGDFYWLAERDGKKIIAACDCTGHGVPGALMSMIGNNLLNHIVNERGITSPDEILNHLHRDIRKTLKQEEQQESRDGMDIAIVVFNSETEIEFAGSQRPLWVLEDSETGRILKEIKGDKFAIGGLQSEKERTFKKHIISLSKGTGIYIFSDGFADQFSDSDKKLMTSRFKELILKIQGQSMDEQESFLGDYIDKWRGKREQIDDILVIGILIK